CRGRVAPARRSSSSGCRRRADARSGTGRRASRPPASPACAARREYTRPAMAITDRYGLPVTTPSAVAAARFQDGMDRLLSRDALLVNQAGSAIGFAGGRDREQQRAVFLERLAPAYGDDWWFQSALAFTYHEVDRFEESRRLSERSLEQYPRNANASHNLAHI